MTRKSPQPQPEWAAGSVPSEPPAGLPLADGRPATASRPSADPQDRRPGLQHRDERLAALSYLGVPFLGPLVPLAIYLLRRRASGYVRRHCAQALNLSITALLYTVCAMILGTMLALDSIVVALVIVVPLVVGLWLAILGCVIVAGSSAWRGEYYQIPAWLCAEMVR